MNIDNIVNGYISSHLGEMYEVYLTFYKRDDWKSVSARLGEKKFRIKDSGQTYRAVNNWEEIGLIDNDREKTGWRKFSFYDLIWIKCISELRDFGFSNEKIKVVKQVLFDNPFPNKRWLLETAVNFSIIEETSPFYFLVTKSGHADIMNPEFFVLFDLFHSSHIKIDLTALVNKHLKREPKINNVIALKGDEVDFIATLRDDADYSEISLNLKNKTIESFKVKENVVAPEIIDLARKCREIGYGEYTVQIVNGKPTLISQKTNTKVTK